MVGPSNGPPSADLIGTGSSFCNNFGSLVCRPLRRSDPDALLGAFKCSDHIGILQVADGSRFWLLGCFAPSSLCRSTFVLLSAKLVMILIISENTSDPNRSRMAIAFVVKFAKSTDGEKYYLSEKSRNRPGRLGGVFAPKWSSTEWCVCRRSGRKCLRNSSHRLRRALESVHLSLIYADPLTCWSLLQTSIRCAHNRP